jgi:NADH-quinone oxidoreductase subunit L
MATGLLIAWYAYIRNPRFPAAFVEQFGFLYRFLLNKWYFDELYNIIFVKPAMWLGRVFWKVGDVGIIDRFGPNGAAWLVSRGSKAAVKLQSGYLYSYALVMLVGLVGAISWVIAR